MLKQRILLYMAIVLHMSSAFGLVFIGREVLAQNIGEGSAAALLPTTEDIPLDSVDNAPTNIAQNGSTIITERQIYRNSSGSEMPMLPIAYGYVEANGLFRGTPNVSVSSFGPGGYAISIDNKDCGDFASGAHCIALVTAVDGAGTHVVALGGDITVYTFVSGLPANNAFQFVVFEL